MGAHQQLIDDLRIPTRELRQGIPDVWEAFQALHRAAMADGNVPARYKELVALAISVVKRCDGCIAFHAKAAARAGATAADVADVLGVTVMMDGGTATVYAPRAWAAFAEFADTRSDVPAMATA
jgi:AhpD family alkylhydroperoxidase